MDGKRAALRERLFAEGFVDVGVDRGTVRVADGAPVRFARPFGDDGGCGAAAGGFVAASAAATAASFFFFQGRVLAILSLLLAVLHSRISCRSNSPPFQQYTHRLTGSLDWCLMKPFFVECLPG